MIWLRRRWFWFGLAGIAVVAYMVARLTGYTESAAFKLGYLALEVTVATGLYVTVLLLWTGVVPHIRWLPPVGISLPYALVLTGVALGQVAEGQPLEGIAWLFTLAAPTTLATYLVWRDRHAA